MYKIMAYGRGVENGYLVFEGDFMECIVWMVMSADDLLEGDWQEWRLVRV